MWPKRFQPLVELPLPINPESYQVREKGQAMRKPFDLIVIGTGTAASTAAYECRSAGWSVAIVDSRPFGGTCALRGCDPKKVLVGAAEVTDWVRRMNGRGVHADGARIDWGELMQFKRTFTDPVPKVRNKVLLKQVSQPFTGVHVSWTLQSLRLEATHWTVTTRLSRRGRCHEV